MTTLLFGPSSPPILATTNEELYTVSFLYATTLFLPMMSTVSTCSHNATNVVKKATFIP